MAEHDPRPGPRGGLPLRPYYETRAPGPQTIADLFQGAWKSRLPKVGESGTAPLFDDHRPAWVARQLPGGFEGRDVLELGPFEGYQTYQLRRLGARRLTAVEGNSVNFLKCLAVNAIYNLRAHYRFGDVAAYLDGTKERFDVVWASGVLYHLQRPVEALREMCRIGEWLYLWTHVWRPSVAALDNGQERHFVPDHDRTESWHGRPVRLHARSYLIADYERRIPDYWEGGTAELTWWLEEEDLLALLGAFGFAVVATEYRGLSPEGLPILSLLARRAPAG